MTHLIYICCYPHLSARILNRSSLGLVVHVNFILHCDEELNNSYSTPVAIPYLEYHVQGAEVPEDPDEQVGVEEGRNDLSCLENTDRCFVELLVLVLRCQY